MPTRVVINAYQGMLKRFYLLNDCKCSFHFADLPIKGKKCTELKKQDVKGVQSFCFCTQNVQNLLRKSNSIITTRARGTLEEHSFACSKPS